MSQSRTPKKTSQRARSAASSAKRAGPGRHETRHYIGIVHNDGPNTAWGITFPDLPGCISAADSFEDLPAQAQEAVALWIETAQDNKTIIPNPSNIETIRCHPDAKDAISYLPIPAPTADRCIRLNITMAETLVRQIDAQVGARARSGFISRAARQMLML